MRLLSLFFFFLSLMAGQTCQPAELPLSGTVDGVIQTTGCTIADLIKGSTNRSTANGWKLTVTRTAVFRIHMTSAELDSLLYIGDASGVIDSDNNGGGSRNALLVIQLNPGSYTIAAAGATTASGAYNLAVSNEAPRPCPIESVTSGSVIEGDISPTDCRFADLFPRVSDGTHLDRYRIEVTAPSVLTATITSAAVDPLILLQAPDNSFLAFDDDSGGGPLGTDARLRISLPKGVYTLIAATAVAGTGTYRFKLDIEQPRTCSALPIVTGDPVRGSLEVTDCRILDLFPFESSEALTDQYRFEVRPGAVAKITMSSAVIDSYLQLLDSSGRIIAANNDVSRTNPDAEIVVSPAPGVYFLHASDYSESIGGAYQILLTTEELRSCPAQPLIIPGATAGSLTSGTCRYLDATQPSSGTAAAAVFSASLSKKSVISITGTGIGFDPLIELRSATGALVSSSARGSLISMLVLPGEYKLIASHRASAGAFRLATEIRDPVECAAAPLSFGTPATGELTTSDCSLREIIPLPVDSSPSDLFQFETVTPDTITLKLTAQGFSPLILILDSDGKIVSLNFGFVPGEPVSLRIPLKTGIWQAVVTALQPEGGTYELSATGTPPTVVQ